MLPFDYRTKQYLNSSIFTLSIGDLIMAKDKLKRPGEIASQSGQYEITGPRGGSTGQERTVVKGEPLPPTPEAGQRYKLVDPTKHKGSE